MEYLNTALSLPWIQWHVHGGFGVRTRWNTDYNDYMAMNGRPGIANYALMWEAGITYNEPGWTYASLTYQMSLTETVQNANFRVNLSEFQIMGRGGFSFIPSDWVSFIAYGGLGYGQYTLKEEDLNSPILGNDLFQNEYETTTYTNPAFMLDLGIDFKATLAFFSIGINGGYMFDVSKQGWKQDGVYIDSSAPLSLGGFYGFATASFYLPY